MSKSAPKTKAQHYVPQFYLERFSLNKQVQVYDKKENRSFSSGTNGIAQEKYFYDIDTELLKTKDQKAFGQLQIAEKALSVIEGHGATTIRMLLQEYRTNGLRRSVRKKLAFFMSIQSLRTRTSRDELTQIFNSVLAGVEDNSPSKSIAEIDINSASASLAEVSQTVLHLQTLFNEEMWNEVSKALVDHIWLIASPSQGKTFWTSDHPVATFPHLPGELKSNAGIASKGIEIAYPISPTCLLILREKSHHASWRNRDGKVVTLSDDDVDFYNMMQVRASSRWLYSVDNHFEKAIELCAAEPALTDENRNRMTLHQGPMLDEDGNYLGDVLHLRKND